MLKGKSIVRRRVMEVIEKHIERAESEYTARLERIHDEYDESRRSLEFKLEADTARALDDVVESITSKILV